MLCNLTYIHVNTRSLKRLKCKLVNLLVIVFSGGFFFGGGDKTTTKKDIKKTNWNLTLKCLLYAVLNCKLPFV